MFLSFFKNHEFISLTSPAHFSLSRFSLHHPACFHISLFNFLSEYSLSFCHLFLRMYDLNMSLHFFLFLIIPHEPFVADSPILHLPKNLIFLVSLHSSSHCYNSQIYFQLLFQTWYSNIIVICLPKLLYVSFFVLVNYSFSHNKFQNESFSL